MTGSGVLSVLYFMAGPLSSLLLMHPMVASVRMRGKKKIISMLCLLIVNTEDSLKVTENADLLLVKTKKNPKQNNPQELLLCAAYKVC